jgi:hypothetical protein
MRFLHEKRRSGNPALNQDLKDTPVIYAPVVKLVKLLVAYLCA